jgi:hypothetical protein
MDCRQIRLISAVALSMLKDSQQGTPTMPNGIAQAFEANAIQLIKAR